MNHKIHFSTSLISVVFSAFQVISFIQKTVGAASGTESQKERDEVLALVNDSSLPKAPWEEGICKVCGMDKDDVNVLLCDTCDSEYHTYCLNPPLGKVPDGNWYCPSCVTGNSLSEDAAYGTQVVNQCGKRRYQRKLIDETLEGLAQLANKMELKEYWEFTVEEVCFQICLKSLSVHFIVAVFNYVLSVMFFE